MEHTILKRHKEVAGCVWQPGMVGPGCRPPSALKKAAMAGKDSYYEMEKYSRITTWLVLALVGLVILRNLVSKLRHSSHPRLSLAVLSIPGYRPLSAVCRGIGYYRPKKIFARRSVLHELTSADRIPSLGNLLTFALPALGLVIWCFAIRPYYRPAAVWGSTPLGVRAGMIANALFPLLFASALKFNPLTFLTGISHEKLQFYHQQTARLILLLAVIHTVPFLWQPVHDGGFANLRAWYYYDKVWWTGTVALALLAWLVASSFGVFRRMSYEFFVLQHVLSIVGFLVFYFMHTRDLLHSWAWLWPSVGVWAFHVVGRFANSLRISKFRGVPATVTLMDAEERLVKVDFTAPVTWVAGQHFFLRFPGVTSTAPYQSHPFTVANLPSHDANVESHLVFVFKARAGLTGKVWEQLARLPEVKGKVSTVMNVGLDGPYGTPFRAEAYGEVLMMVGGVGMTSALPALMQLCLAARSAREAGTRRVSVHWAVQSRRTYEAFEPSLRAVVEHLRVLGVDAGLDVYCREAASEEKDGGAKSSFRIHGQRADVPSIVTRFVATASKTVGVSVCGPASMLNETANTVAKLQWSHVLAKPSGVQELYLHTEAFDW